MITKLKFLFPVGYMLLIYGLSSVPMTATTGPTHTTAWHITQNLLHVPIYSVLAILWMIALAGNKAILKPAIIYTIILTLIYAGFDEFHQSLVPGRAMELSDFLLDSLGCFIGVILYFSYSIRNTQNPIPNTQYTIHKS